MESNMLKNIVQTANYSVSVNPKEQRLYVTMKGCTTQALEPSQYMEKLYEIMHSISQGGTALLNARQKKGQSQEHMTFARYFQEFLVEGGVLKIAEILPDSVILYMDHDRIARLADTSGK